MPSDFENIDFPILKKAPLTEALIDIQAKLPENIEVAALRNLQTVESDRFTKIEPRGSVEGHIHLDQEGAHFEGGGPLKPDGFIFSSDSEQLRVQARLDGFTISKLPPYSDWESLLFDAKNLWEAYIKAAHPVSVTRLAVRYINKFDLTPNRDFKEFLLTVPEIAPGLPQSLPDFLMRLVVPHESGAIAVITESSAPREADAPNYPMILDIDVFRSVELSADDPEIWSILGELRAYKNLIFFKSLTPEFLENFR